MTVGIEVSSVGDCEGDWDGTTEGNLVGFLELRRVGRHVG